MRRVLLTALALLLLAPHARAEILLEGRPAQGGVVFGKTEPGAEIRLDGRKIAVGPEGHFVLGFDHQAAPEARLSVAHKDGRGETKFLKVAKREFKIQRIDGLPEKKVTPDPEDLKRIERENAEIKEARRIESADTLYRSGFRPPVEAPISGVYGSQRILNGQPRAPHLGTDFAAPAGTPVAAIADATVSFVHQDMFFTGKTLMLDHGQGLQSVYAHLSEIAVRPGQRVRQGEIVGKIGASGRATGAHLHLGLTWFETRLDPELALGLAPPR